MKYIVPIIIIFFCFLNSCEDIDDRYNEDSDEMVKKEDIRKIRKGMSKQEVLNLLGNGYRDRLTYKPPMPRKFDNGKLVNVDFLLSYHYYEKESKKYPGIQESYITKTIDIAIFFEKGILVEYYINENPPDEHFRNFIPSQNMKGHWPNSFCDFKYYVKIVNKKHDNIGSFDSLECEWMNTINEK
ncbi:hypothetical protein [Leptospira kanakyensis]|uniref:hypothetical protein n=1 Tax=Leptospira kanakyensis TaxID=2484968 RepID=UPI00223CCF63|nr:hypothetical protein [Leptospira kanakyensis]MCW7471717.1 outer membrane protein assembly factor BamE [Leptospira kanakyensis]